MINKNMIPLVDLNAQYLEIKEEIDTAINKCVIEGNFINGNTVTDFENAFKEFIGTKYCVGCGNGTDALELILKSLNIGAGDEVIVPALTWIATAEAVNNVGAQPVFVDIDKNTYTINVNKIEEKVTKNTRAIIPVHLYGCPADMDKIIRIAEKFNFFIIEDCAQAHGAEYKGRKIGTFGTASSFSFFPSKNLGAFGDAGAVVTSNEELAGKIRRLANHGQLYTRHSHSIIGRNSRLDGIQAAILKTKLHYLDSWNQSRIRAAKYYMSKLNGVKEIVLPSIIPDTKHVFHLFVIRTNRREELIQALKKNGIATSIHYPTPLPLLEAYNYKQHKPEDFPVATYTSREILSIPIYPEISNIQLDTISGSISEFCNCK